MRAPAPALPTALAMAALLTVLAAGGIALYPAALTAWVARWDSNAALRAARLAEAGRLDEAEAALRRAAALPTQWTDRRGETRQRVFLGRHVQPAHRPFHRAALAFLEAGRHEAALQAAWESLFRYHSVNRAGQPAELWRALARAADALGDTATAELAALIADHAPLAPPAEAIARVQDRAAFEGATADGDGDSGGGGRGEDVQPLPTDAFVVWRNGRFNPANIVTTDSQTLLFDHPCVVAVALPDRGGAGGDGGGAGRDGGGAAGRALVFSARGWSAYGWPPILVFEALDGRWRRPWIAPVGEGDGDGDGDSWTAGRIALPDDPGGRLIITYLNHGAEERGGDAEPVRRMVALRQMFSIINDQ